jgi:hypothetical protein
MLTYADAHTHDFHGSNQAHNGTLRDAKPHGILGAGAAKTMARYRDNDRASNGLTRLHQQPPPHLGGSMASFVGLCTSSLTSPLRGRVINFSILMVRINPRK